MAIIGRFIYGKGVSLLALFSFVIIIFTAPVIAAGTRLTHQGIQFPDGTLQTTKATENSTAITNLEQAVTGLQEQIVYLKSLHGVNGNFVEGLTSGTYDGNCTLKGSALFDGRTEWFFECKGWNSYPSYSWVASFVTGKIVGHPYESLLTSAGIDKINGWESAIWGQILSMDPANVTWYSCLYKDTNGIISVRQVGDTLNFKFYGNDNVLDCGFMKSLTQ